jgi:hypothetical protein
LADASVLLGGEGDSGGEYNRDKDEDVSSGGGCGRGGAGRIRSGSGEGVGGVIHVGQTNPGGSRCTAERRAAAIADPDPADPAPPAPASGSMSKRRSGWDTESAFGSPKSSTGREVEEKDLTSESDGGRRPFLPFALRTVGNRWLGDKGLIGQG